MLQTVIMKIYTPANNFIANKIKQRKGKNGRKILEIPLEILKRVCYNKNR